MGPAVAWKRHRPSGDSIPLQKSLQSGDSRCVRRRTLRSRSARTHAAHLLDSGVPLENCLVGALLHRVNSGRFAEGRGPMYAIVYKSDGFPICRQVAGVSPDPVVTWNDEAAAKAFIASKGGDAEFQPLQLTDDAMDKLAKTMNCPVEAMTFEPYPS